MARPDTDDGYTRIANELLEAILLHGFTKRELTVLLAVIRNTYGWHRKRCQISTRWIESKTALSRRHAGAVLRSLVDQHVLFCEQPPRGSRPGFFTVNKDYETWLFREDLRGPQAVPQSGADEEEDSSEATPSVTRSCDEIPSKFAAPQSGTKTAPTKEKDKDIKKRPPTVPHDVEPLSYSDVLAEMDRPEVELVGFAKCISKADEYCQQLTFCPLTGSYLAQLEDWARPAIEGGKATPEDVLAALVYGLDATRHAQTRRKIGQPWKYANGAARNALADAVGHRETLEKLAKAGKLPKTVPHFRFKPRAAKPKAVGQ